MGPVGTRAALPRPVGRVAAGAPAAAAATYYADAVRGNDSATGSLAAPFRTVARALRAARGGPAPADVVLRNGTFYLDAPLLLTAEDSFLTITSYEGETAVLSAGVPLEGLVWTRVPGGGGGGGMSPEAAGQNNLANCNLNNPGESSDGCKYNGIAPDSATCRAACAANATCTSYTYHDDSTGVWARCCYFRVDAVWAPYAEGGHFSGYKYPAGPQNLWRTDVERAGAAWLPFDTLFLGGRRAVRARAPNGNPEITIQPAGFTSAASWLPPVAAPPPQEVHVASPSRAFDPW